MDSPNLPREPAPVAPALPAATKRSVDGYQTNVVKDWTDLRDQIYRPSLLQLRAKTSPDELLFDRNAASGRLRIRIRNQGDEGSCTGQALAALIDILRLGQSANDETAPPASARMLFEMAKQEDRGREGNGEQVYTLRAALKGFYHNGVCPEDVWPYVDGDPRGKLQVDRAKAARSVSLGAYYRLEPILNHYHTAIAEVGAIYVAAETHVGWSRKHVTEHEGRIASMHTGTGGHAFVIVGYDETGFLVLNSWGEEWGGFRPSRQSTPLPGIAHWSYEDWADSIRDAWVLRVAAPTPDAFNLTIGTQGLFAGSSALGSSSTPRAELIGHYVHFDDGTHVTKGNYPSSKESVAETFRYLRGEKGDGKAQGKTVVEEDKSARPYQHVLLWLAGGIESTKQAFTYAAKMKPRWTERGIYPINVIWCTDFVEQAKVVLDHVFKLAEAQAGETAAELDFLIEQKMQGIGRAFWRDVQRAATEAAGYKGSFFHLLEQASAACQGCGNYKLHIVAEGAGAVLLGSLLDRLHKGATPEDSALQPAFFAAVDTLSLVAPACTVRAFGNQYRGLIDHLQSKEMDRPREARRKRPKVALYVPTVALEKRMRVGLYGKSMLHLIANGFEDRNDLDVWRERSSGDLRGPELLGMAVDSDSATKTLIEVDPDFAMVQVDQIGPRADLPDTVGHEEITRNPKVVEAILRRIGAKGSA
ncbi:MAG: C1 family peptidase [Geminicoccaceae bacterium]